MAIETAMPKVPRHAIYTGCVCDQLSWQMARSGLLTATARLWSRRAKASRRPRPLARPLHWRCSGSGNTTGRSPAAAPRSVSRIDGADPGMAALTGRVEVRFADTALIAQAIDGTPCELVFAWNVGANASFTFTAHAVHLPRPRIEIPGPQGTQATFDWQAAKPVSPARMCTVVPVNTVVSHGS